MQYIVCNLLGEGVRSVGTHPLNLDGAVWSAALRTGRSEREVAETIGQLSPLVPAVSVPAAEGTANTCAVRIEVVR